MSQLALYRKYRSQTFSDLVGQGHVVKTLQSGIEQGKFSHAYLFTGPRGTGKTSTARLLAKALNCEHGPAVEPCNECEACTSITNGTSMDVLEMDAASESGVDDVREAIVEASEYQPAYCRFRVFIIDEVHDLSPKAFDALLKTIEEPPAHVVFILATTEYNKVPPTVRSRCQRFEFHRGTVQDLAGRLAHVAEQEKIECEPSALAAIARMADGGFRDALTLFEQAMLTSDGKVTLEQVYDQLGLIADETTDTVLKAMSQGDIAAIVTNLDEIYRSGRDPRSIVESLILRLSELTRAVYGVEVGALSDASLEAGLTSTAGELGKDKILRFRSGLAVVHRNVRDVSLPRVWIEAELIRISQSKIAATPQPVARTAEPAKPKPAPVKEKPPEPKAKKVDAPAPVSPQPTGDAQHDELAGAWHAVVKELSGISKVAAMRLVKSRVAEVKGYTAKIEFARQSDAEWVTDSVKLQRAISDSWNKNGGDGYTLKFTSAKKLDNGAKLPETATVELAAEGEALEKLGQEVFGQKETTEKS